MTEHPGHDDDMVSGDILNEIVENQVKDNNPTKVKETLMRLTMSGMSREDAIMHIGCALALEMVDVVDAGKTFNEKRYSEHLDCLPEMPWEDD